MYRFKTSCSQDQLLSTSKDPTAGKAVLQPLGEMIQPTLAANLSVRIRRQRKSEGKSDR